MEEEAHSSKEEVNEVHHMRETLTFGKKAGTTVEHSEEGGVFMPDQAGKPTPWNAATMPSSVTMRRSVEKRKVRRLPQVGNSQTTPPTLTMRIMVECP